jgi:hypothetical protein
MNQANVRSLAGVTTAGSQISMNCFYGKTMPPTTLGQVYQGGYYTGVVDIGGGVCYYMIVAPNATGCANCQWKVTRTASSGTCSTVDGRLNTSNMTNNDHPAANWTATRSIGGYSDWYLPARNETGTMYTNKNSMPAGEGFNSDVSAPAYYWSSTECSNIAFAFIKRFLNGNELAFAKTNPNYSVRALRRSSV